LARTQNSRDRSHIPIRFLGTDVKGDSLKIVAVNGGPESPDSSGWVAELLKDSTMPETMPTINQKHPKTPNCNQSIEALSH
jgi:hypothetical protein